MPIIEDIEGEALELGDIEGDRDALGDWEALPELEGLTLTFGAWTVTSGVGTEISICLIESSNSSAFCLLKTEVSSMVLIKPSSLTISSSIGLVLSLALAIWM